MKLKFRVNAVYASIAALFSLTACEQSKMAESKKAIPVAVQIAQDVAQLEAAVPVNPLKDAYFGDTHVHTAYSLDAYIGGASKMTPDMAYRFAKGEAVEIDGQKLKLHKPLDWGVVTDHAEYLGDMFATLNEGTSGSDHPLIKELRTLNTLEEKQKWFLKYVVNNNRSDTPTHPDFWPGVESEKNGWKIELEATAKNYEPGKFTTLAGYEWSAAPKGGNLHRNVIFRDMNVPDKVMSYLDIHREDALWDWLASLEQKGSKVLAIPHNSNGSKGMMFDPNDPSGKPIDKTYADKRAKWEPLIEMMQIKANSEVHRQFWSNDEFADFENGDSMAKFSGRVALKQNYVRNGLTQGLTYQKTLGTNPYKYGFVGGTDSHNGAMGNTRDDNYPVGSHGAADNTVERRRTAEIDGWIAARDSNPGSLTGAWAESNTRGAIWDALKRKETFATSGTRMKVRMFASFDYGDDLVKQSDMIKAAYAAGVPMGGDLPKVSGKKLPKFLVMAMKDADGANLDRIQIIKGWTDKAGKTHEKIINVAWSGDRKLDKNGKLPAVGNTVDLKTAKYTNDIGSAGLIGMWTDPEFDPAQNALYYVRAIEIPTPRWSTFDAVHNNLPLLPDVPSTIQERAWGSPIWYTAG